MASSSSFYNYWAKILQESQYLKNWIELNFREIVEDEYYNGVNVNVDLKTLKTHDLLTILRDLKDSAQWDVANFLAQEICAIESSQKTGGKGNYCQTLFKNLETWGLISKISMAGPPEPMEDETTGMLNQRPGDESLLNQSQGSMLSALIQQAENIKFKIACWNNSQRNQQQKFISPTEETLQVQLADIELQIKVLLDTYWNFAIQDAQGKNIILNLIQALFVVTTQPTQHDRRIIRYNQKFTTVVRFLFPKEYLALGSTPHVTVVIINHKKEIAVPQLLKNSAYLSPHGENGYLEAAFSPKLPATKPVKMDKQDAKLNTVHEENFWAQYELKMNLRNLECEPIKVGLTSFPFKIIGNSSQDMGALEALVWGNAAGIFDIIPTALRPQILPFQAIKEAINSLMQPYGQPFSDTDFTRVIRKVLGPQVLDVILKSGEMTLEQYRIAQEVPGLGLFDTKNRPITKISFWGWFYYLIEFISEHLCCSKTNTVGEWWREKKVIGYIPNEESLEILQKCPERTALIRFSNSKPDAVTLEWIENSRLFSYRATTAELEERNLFYRIMDIDQWEYIYPNEEKDKLFQVPSSFGPTRRAFLTRNYPNQEVRIHGYVLGHVKAYLDIPNDSPVHPENFE